MTVFSSALSPGKVKGELWEVVLALTAGGVGKFISDEPSEKMDEELLDKTEAEGGGVLRREREGEREERMAGQRCNF